MEKSTNNRLLNNIKTYIDEAREFVVQNVNTAMVYTYYHVGKIIVEDEQSGSERASYAKQTLKLLSLKLNQEYGKGYSVDNLEYMRLFYIEYRISETLSRISETPFKLSWSHYIQLLKIKELPERKFYELECLTGNWSVRELKRQYHSSMYERLLINIRSI